MDWTKGFSASYYMKEVDAPTWRDTETIEITGGTLKRESAGLMHSADISCINYPQGTERWVRVYLDTKQNGASEHVALFTGLATSPSKNIKGSYESNKVQCYSVLKPADDVLLPRGWYAPMTNGAQVVAQLLSVTPAPIEVAEDSPVLSNYIVAEDGETNLSMADKILDAINWRKYITGDGTVRIEPKPTDPVITFDALDNDVILTDIDIEADWYECPNVFRAVSEDLIAVARDDSEDSPLSTVNRGREVWAEDTGAELADNETIGQYAMRKLRESQRIKTKANYRRAYAPTVMPTDLVRIHYPRLDGVFQVDNQSIELTHGAMTTETVTTEA